MAVTNYYFHCSFKENVILTDFFFLVGLRNVRLFLSMKVFFFFLGIMVIRLNFFFNKVKKFSIFSLKKKKKNTKLLNCFTF